MSSEPGYHGTIAPCLQTTPIVVTSGPGVITSIGPVLHCRRDLPDFASHAAKLPA